MSAALCPKPDSGLSCLQCFHLRLIMLYDRLAIYYLNAVSKGYQQANMDLKRKMQMVSMSVLLLCPSSVFFLLFPSFFSKSSIKQMTVWLIGGHFRLATRRRTAGTTRTALIKWWKTWRTCCQTSLSYRLPQRRKSYPHLVHSHTHPHSPIPLLYAISQFAPDCPHRSCCSPSVISDVVIEKGSKSPKTKQGAAAKRVNLQKDVSLAAPNPRAPVTRAPGPRRGPAGNARGPPPGPGRGRGRGGPPRQ